MKRISYQILLIVVVGNSALGQVLTKPTGTIVGDNTTTDQVHVNGYTRLLNPNGRVLEITRDNDDAYLTFHDPGDAWYSMGIDRSDGFKFKLNYGGDLLAQNQFTLTDDGKFGFGTNTPEAKIETGSIPENHPAFKTMDFQIVPFLGGGGWNGISQPNDVGLIFKSGRSLVIAPHSPSTSGLRITAAGDVGVGAVSPEGLQVNIPLSGETSKTVDNIRIGTLGGTPRIILDDAGYSPFEIDNAAGRFRIFTPGVERFTITADGNIGIGTATPSAKLVVTEPMNENAAVVISNILIVPNLLNGSYNGISKVGDAGIILTDNKSFVIAPHKNET
ncbi:MAG: hypothetical protein O9262_02560, partial [Cyclobacteriaceae bacterium]|nr:hypothetical protein [Cyclobacteriaceae bacterium]